ncbi:MAG TPA: response regulator [Actinomycetota bacterium]|jgi:signal transduction histidine kinase/DNA-binding NarL/FixJ family response regulator
MLGGDARVTDRDAGPVASGREREPTAALTAVVEDLAGEFSLRPLLERILRRSTELLGCDAGSICLVDEAAGVYRKEADIGVACQSGKVFPLTEGVTGAVVASRGPVTFDDYAKVPDGHVRPEDRASLRAVIGVPIWWRGAIIGSCVVFTRDPERIFTHEDAELLELFAKHAAIAITNARLHEEAETNARAEAAAAERNRMAREVHDAVAQGLVSVLLQVRAAHGAITGGRTDEAVDALGEARAAAEAAFEETRRSVLGLAPSPLEGRSLEEALELELAWANRSGVADARLVTAGTPVDLPTDLAHTLFRIAQEALTNALRHARARSVRVGVVHAPNGVTVLVQDDGVGFDRNHLRQDGVEHGHGLEGMAERARLLGGTLELDSTPGWGTRVRAWVPLPADAPAEDAARPVRVLVVDDHSVTRAGIVRLLSAAEPPVQVVGEAASGEQAVAAWRSLQPDVVLMDLKMPNGDGTEAITRIRAEDPDASIVALTAFASDDTVAGAFRAGARGYVGKNASEAELTGAVLAASRGGVVLSGPAVDRLHARMNGWGDHLALTEREGQVLGFLERGAPDREIATALGISVKTVEKHVSSILRKTGAHNRTQAVARAREEAAG